MDYPVSPTQILYDLIITDSDMLSKIHAFWDLPIMDYKRGCEVSQDRFGRIEDLRDAFYAEADSVYFKSKFIGKVFDALTEDIDWTELHDMLYEGGGQDED
jgi:hypothetical protein